MWTPPPSTAPTHSSHNSKLQDVHFCTQGVWLYLKPECKTYLFSYTGCPTEIRFFEALIRGRIIKLNWKQIFLLITMEMEICFSVIFIFGTLTLASKWPPFFFRHNSTLRRKFCVARITFDLSIDAAASVTISMIYCNDSGFFSLTISWKSPQNQ